MINDFYNQKLEILKFHKIDNPNLNLKLLISKSSKKIIPLFIKDIKLSNIDIKKFNKYFDRHVKGEPLSKIFNNREFYSLNFYINKNVLDPRPETELIIDSIRKHFKQNKKKLFFCDLGTGSGCIILTLLKYYNKSIGLGIDISKKAIDVAKKNAEKLNVQNRVSFKNINWNSIKGNFDIIVCNPPYINSYDYNNLEKCVKKYDPKIALLSGKSGYEKVIEIAKNADKLMKRTSILVVEIGLHQRNRIEEIYKNQGFEIFDIMKDLQGIERVLIFKKNK